MSVRRESKRVAALLWAGLVVTSCLPKDTRPVPGRVDVTMTSATAEGSVKTVDGWSVTFERALTSMRPSIDGDACAEYYNDGYSRILDLGVSGPQKVCTLYSLGHCDFSFRVQSPSTSPYTPLGERVTPADKALMNTASVDPYTKDRNGNSIQTGIALYVSGHAERSGEKKSFTWAFRQRVQYEDCSSPNSDGASRSTDAAAASDGGDAGPLPPFTDAGSPGPRGLDIATDAALSVDIRMHPEALFHDTTNLAVGALRFDLIARADDAYGDGDGDVTLAELGLVPLEEVGGGGRYQEPPAVGAPAPNTPPAPAWKTLEDFVYLGLYPKIARYEERGICATRTGGGGR